MPRAETEALAGLALVYRELAAPAEHLGLSLIANAAFGLLANPTDDAIFEALQRPEVLPHLLPQLAEASPFRAEALLHAFPPDDGLPTEEWAEPLLGRWAEVEEAMEQLCRFGIAAPRHAVEELARFAAAAGGANG